MGKLYKGLKRMTRIVLLLALVMGAATPIPAWASNGQASSASAEPGRAIYSMEKKVAHLAKRRESEPVSEGFSLSDSQESVFRFFSEHWGGALSIFVVGLLVIALILQNRKAERKAHEQQRLLEEAAKVAELQKSMTSLLDNIPGLSFSKDAKTGVYLACNQAFAKFAHKPSPEAVVGLTDADLFGEETARHFAEDDHLALAMVEPYVFFEDVQDAAGHQKQFQTTKLKYIDASGRLCLLSVCQDMTDELRIQRENAATKEAYERVKSSSVIFTHIAKTLARGYSDFYYVNLDTGVFIEYRTDEESGEFTETRRGEKFFETCKVDIGRVVHPEDREAVVRALDRENLLNALERDGTFMMPYRLLSGNGSVYVNLRISRMDDDDRFIIIGVTDIDEQVKRRQAEEQMKEERIAFSRINALAGDYICIYVVDPETERYVEYSASSQFDRFEIPKEGTDFFATSRKNGESVVYPDDLERSNSMLTKENVLATIEQLGLFTMTYRLMINDKPTYVRLKAALVDEAEGRRLIVGINDVDAQIRKEAEFANLLAHAQREANVDALTGVKNRHAYLEAEEQIDRALAEHRAEQFAVVILDVNDLKQVNDTLGHHAGDEHIRNACKIICDIFKHSPVFRLGGDEFAVIAQGADYQSIEDLIERMSVHNKEATRTGGIVIACGMAKYKDDGSVAPVFERADQNMYVNKSNLKAVKENRMAG